MSGTPEQSLTPRQQLQQDTIASFISTELAPTLIAMRHFGVSQLDVDLTGMSIRLHYRMKVEPEQVLITFSHQITDPPEAE